MSMDPFFSLNQRYAEPSSSKPYTPATYLKTQMAQYGKQPDADVQMRQIAEFRQKEKDYYQKMEDRAAEAEINLANYKLKAAEAAKFHEEQLSKYKEQMEAMIISSKRLLNATISTSVHSRSRNVQRQPETRENDTDRVVELDRPGEDTDRAAGGDDDA